MAQLIELTNRNGLDYLQGLVQRVSNMRPVLLEIGEDMAESAKQRFSSTTAPKSLVAPRAAPTKTATATSRSGTPSSCSSTGLRTA